jgi:nucleoside-diphosphate-sugar epimerase
MRVLLTGASSFTGAWFVHALAEAGAEVIVLRRGRWAEDDAARRRRLRWLDGRCRLIEGCPFGSEPFLEALRAVGRFDIFCHHGAEVGDHRRLDADPLAAAAANTQAIERVVEAIMAQGCGTLLLTGSVFEADEGRGEPPLRAFSPYGLSKTLTWHVFRYHAERHGLALGKFVIASPFGPLDKPAGLVRSLVETWRQGGAAVIRRPQLVRDHLQVQPLARAYARFATTLPAQRGTLRQVPSQFPERLDRFAARLAAALGPRLGWACRFVAADPPEPAEEPLVRRGSTPLARLVSDLDPERAWDEAARCWSCDDASRVEKS